MLKAIFQRFKRNEDGNISIMFVGSFVTLNLLAGVAIDLSLMHKAQEKLQDITDAAALAAVKHGGTIQDRKTYFNEYVNLLADMSNDARPVVSDTLTIEETDTSISLEANVSMPHDLVWLDNFFSFDHVAATTKVEIGVENIEVALAIDISSSMKGARLTEAKASTELFIKQLLNDSSTINQISISLIPFGGTVRVPEELSHLLDVPKKGLKDYSQHWIGGEWNQCFEYDISDISDGIDPKGSYSVTPDFWSWNKTNPWCPLAGNEFVPLTDDADNLLNKVATLSLSDGTGSDHGMRWAFETLNHEWVNKLPGGLENTPAANDDDTKKYIVFMTDGGITEQHYVQNRYISGSPPYNSRRKKMTTFNESLNAFYESCDEAKDNDIEVYTIGYNLSRDTAEEQLKNCASTSANYIDASTGNLESVFAKHYLQEE